MEEQGLKCGFCAGVTPKEVSFHISSQEPPCRGPLDKHNLGGFNQPLADKQTNKQIISLNAYLLACLPEGGQVLAHSGWVMGLEEKLSKGTETTQEIHEGL